jgi:excisionase family DNA binding protein
MTVVPTGGTAPNVGELQRFAIRSLRGRRLRLVVDDEAPMEVPSAVAEALAEVVSILSRGRPVLIQAQNVQVSTGEAAEFLGVSRPTVVKLMEDGEIPFTRPNSSRRVALHDLLAYKEGRSRARRAVLDELTADAVQAGIYDEQIHRGRQERGGVADADR